MTRLLFIPDSHTLLWLDPNESPPELVRTIRSGEWIPPAPFLNLRGKLLAYWQEGLVIATAVPLEADPGAVRPRLSRRSREILKGLVEGLTTRQMAVRLGVQPRTIYNHIAHLKVTLGVTSRVELALKARELLR